MITIQVKVTGHELSLVSSPILSSDSIQFDRINFQFDSNWDGFNKVALFWGGDSDTPYGALVDENNNATIPAEVIAEKGTIRFGVYGEDPEDLRPRITSTILKYKVREGTWSDSVAGDEEVTETLVEQLRQLAYNALIDTREFMSDAQDYLDRAQETTDQLVEDCEQAIDDYISEARATSQEYLDEVTEVAEGAKDSAKVAAQAAIDAAAPSLSYTVLFEYTSGPKILSALGDTLTINNIDEYDYIEFIFRDDYSGNDGTSSPQHRNITSLKLPLIFDNNNEMEFCLEQNTPEFISPDYKLDSFQHNVIKINKNNHTLTVVEAFGSYVGTGSNVGNVCGSGRVSDTNAWTSTINIIKIIGWKYASIASMDVAVHDPELLDVRIGADGTVYASAGDAVRAHEDVVNEIADDVADLKSELTAPFVWKDGYYSIATGAFAPQSGTVTYHSTEKFLGNEMPNIYNWDLVQSGDSFFMVWNNGTYAGYLMDGVWKKNTTVLDEPPAFTEWAIVLHNEPNYQDVRLIPFSTDAFGKIAVIIPRYSDNRKIAITDTEIVFPALTKIVYDYGYYAKSSTITVTRSAPAGGTVSDEVVVFDIASKTIKTYPTTNFNIASTERILFTLGIGDKSCSLAGSMYTYNGKPPFMPYDTARNTTIINLNDVSDLTEKIIETKYCGNNSKTGLSLIHFSDIHGSTTNIQRIIDLADYYSTYVDDIIHTGDSVATYYANNNPFATVGGDRVLNAIGNHDCWIEGDTWPHPYNATAAQTYDKFLSPYISSWGVTSAGTNLCYYYKDYSPYNIRLIVLDALHYDSAQETWLTSALAGAKTNGYSVIIAEHYPPQTGITAFDCTFTSYGISVDPVADPEEGAQIERLPESAYSVVDSYINGGGKFICWLAGHTHYDYIGKVTGHLNQIVVLINCGVVDARYGTDKRVNGTKTQDCLNVVGFDTTNHIIKICRVGISIDWFGRAKNYISIDYDNKQIIANS